MKLAAVYNVWDDTNCILPYSITNILNHVDEVFIVYSVRSNTGEYGGDRLVPVHPRITNVLYDPNSFEEPMVMERNKRNYGLNVVRNKGYTHIITMDGDEFYTPSDLLNARNIMEADHSLNGIVVKSQVYFKRPDLTIGLDTTLVPFIHKITPTLQYQMSRKYPYAWVDNVIRIDPTRQFNISSGVMMSKNIVMHHYSYVRKDLEIKIRNSSARGNIENSTIREDWANAKEGYFCKFYGKTLTKCENLFELPLDW